MQALLVDTVGLDVILEVINPVLDLGQDFAPEDRRRVFQDLVERLLERLYAIALRQRFDAAAAEPAPCSASRSPLRCSDRRELRTMMRKAASLRLPRS